MSLNDSRCVVTTRKVRPPTVASASTQPRFAMTKPPKRGVVVE